jgi:beta-glucosidase
VSSRLVTILEGIAAKTPESVTLDYRPGCLSAHNADNPVEWAIFEASGADVTVAILGFEPMLEGEEGDALSSRHIGDREYIELPPNQLQFLKSLRERAKKLVLVLTGGGAVSVPPELADAILMCWYPGEEGGNAVADALFGDANPSGKLPVTFYKSTADLPPFEDYRMEGRTYRYFKGEPLYPFGFGLSYARFQYGNLSLSSQSIKRNERLEVTFTVTNAGTVAGEETVQLYLSDAEASCRAPLWSLKDLRRVSLKPGESTNLSFSVTPAMLGLVDETGATVLEPGLFRLSIGGCSPGARGVALGASQSLAAEFTLEGHA